MMKTTQQIKSKKVLIATVVMTAMASTSVSAYEQISDKAQALAVKNQKQIVTDNENIGFGTGALIGGIVAGPIGAFVAGIGGVFVAKYININDEKEALTIVLTKEQQAHELNKEQANKQYQAKLQQLKNSYQQQLMALENQQQNTGQIQAEKLLMSLQFSTGSSDIAPHYQEQVAALAQILNSSPTMKIDLSGYTDLTGEESLNQTLSQARVASVKNLLMAQGVQQQQIATFAFGESSPIVANNEREVSFYDRRVVLKLHKPAEVHNNQMAKNH